MNHTKPKYKIRTVLKFVHDSKQFVSARDVADNVGISWNTAKKILESLCNCGYLIRCNIGKKSEYVFDSKKKKIIDINLMFSEERHPPNTKKENKTNKHETFHK